MEQLFKNIAKDFRKLKCEQNSNCGFGENMLLVLKCQTPWPNKKKKPQKQTKVNTTPQEKTLQNISKYSQQQQSQPEWTLPRHVCPESSTSESLCEEQEALIQDPDKSVL